jgi:DNA repair protein RAD16
MGGGSGSSGEESVYTPDETSTPAYPGETPDDSDLSELEAEESDLSDESEAPKGKGKAKAKGKGKGKGSRGSKAFSGSGRELGSGKEIDWFLKNMADSTAHFGYTDRFDYETDEEYEQRCYKLYKHDLQDALKSQFKKEERVLKQEIGRKLTNGEKNFIRLVKVSPRVVPRWRARAERQFHPELRNVWGDVAEKITPVKPVPMEAHPSLKLTLLPFQKESLHWMKKQEEGPWKGGMLADEMGMGKT